MLIITIKFIHVTMMDLEGKLHGLRSGFFREALRLLKGLLYLLDL